MRSNCADQAVKRIRFGGVQHVAHGESDGIQIVLNAQELQGIFAVAIDHVALQATKSGKLHGDVGGIGQNGRESDDQSEQQAGGWRALGSEFRCGAREENTSGDDAAAQYRDDEQSW